MKRNPDPQWVLGIDTSNYTCSVAAVSTDGLLLDHQRQLLTVEKGERGLRQSEALFAQLKTIDKVFSSLQHAPTTPRAIGVSDRPRALPESYMPVFLVGLQFGRVLSQLLGIPLLLYSHQEGHIEAGVYSAQMPLDGPFLAIHLSGGTTEMLRVEKKGIGYQEQIIAETADLSAGQLVDRLGVAMGLPFPSGPSLEKLAQGSQNPVRISSSFKNGKLHFSGAEAQALRYLQEGNSPMEIARGIENCIATTLEKMILWGMVQTGLKSILIVGGVAANLHLRRRLQHRLEHPAVAAKLYFATAELSSDNAVGIALLAAEQLKVEC